MNPDHISVRLGKRGRAEELKDPQGAEDDDGVDAGYLGDEVGQEGGDGEDSDDAVEGVPAVAPVALRAVLDVFHHHFHDEYQRADDVDQTKGHVVHAALLDEYHHHIQYDDGQEQFLVEQYFLHSKAFIVQLRFTVRIAKVRKKYSFGIPSYFLYLCSRNNFFSRGCQIAVGKCVFDYKRL